MSSGNNPFGPVLKNGFGESYLPSINREIFSRSGSDSFYRAHFGKGLRQEDSLYLIVGTDGGLLVKWVLNQGMAEGSRYLFIEMAPLIERMREEGLLPEELPEGMKICAPDEWMAEADDLSIKDYAYLNHVRRIKSLAVVDAFHEGFLPVWNTFEEHLDQFMMQINQEVGSRVFMEKGLENLAENSLPAPLLENVFEGRTAVLLAGGPSLRESFDWVKRHRQNLVVLAVARIAPQLSEAGIDPDLFFAIDPHGIIFHQSKEMLAFWRRTLLVNVYHLNPRLLGQWRGPSVYMGAPYPWPTELNTENYAFPGITVGHQALGMGIKMGFSTIVLAGFDLCFDREGFTHVAGSVEQTVGPYNVPSELQVETNGGWMAETKHDFLNAIPSLAVLAKVAVEKEPVCRLVNPAPGAAKIENIDHLPWDSLTPTPLDEPAWESIRKTLPEENRQTRLDHYKTVETELNRVRGEVRKIQRLATEALDCNERLFGRKGRLGDYKYKKRMDAIEETLDGETFRDLSRLVKKWGVQAFLKLSRPNKDREWTDAEIEEAGRRYYEVYRDNASSVIRRLDEVRQRIRMRMEEEKPKPNYKSLLAQWKKDEQVGRFQLFLDRRGITLADLPAAIAGRFRDLATEYDSILRETGHDFKKHCMQRRATPQGIRAKAVSFFRHKEIDKLRHFWSGLEKSEIEDKPQYGLLINGYLAELEGDTDRALTAYRQITHSWLLTDAMLRQFSLYLLKQDMLSATAISKRLADRSTIYMPYYADLLRLSGKAREAIDEYRRYTKIVKNDFVTLLKLGKLHLDLGEIEEARTLFQQILEEDPGNKAAGQFMQRIAGA